MATQTFRATIALNGINPYVPVSAARAAKLKAGWRKPMPVRVRIDGKPATPWRINLMPAGGGAFYLYLHASVRRASGTGVGDRVAVELAFDETYRAGPAELPDGLARAFARNAAARRGFEALTPSRQKEIVRYLANLKSAQARQRNLAKTLHVLTGGRGRFMGRDWDAAAAPSATRKSARAKTPRRRSK